MKQNKSKDRKEKKEKECNVINKKKHRLKRMMQNTRLK
jgi:hypothetical protein